MRPVSRDKRRTQTRARTASDGSSFLRRALGVGAVPLGRACATQQTSTTRTNESFVDIQFAHAHIRTHTRRATRLAQNARDQQTNAPLRRAARRAASAASARHATTPQSRVASTTTLATTTRHLAATAAGSLCTQLFGSSRMICSRTQLTQTSQPTPSFEISSRECRSLRLRHWLRRPAVSRVVCARVCVAFGLLTAPLAPHAHTHARTLARTHGARAVKLDFMSMVDKDDPGANGGVANGVATRRRGERLCVCALVSRCRLAQLSSRRYDLRADRRDCCRLVRQCI